MDTALISNICDPIFTQLKRPWDFDDRFGAALLVYAAEEEGEIRGVLDAAFANEWTSETLSLAPAGMQELVNSVGGLDVRQRFCHSDPDGVIGVFATVWPWGGGAKISLRIGCWGEDLSPADLGAVHAKLKACFGLG